MSTIKIRLKRLEATTLIRVLITHPMDTGRKRDKDSGRIIPAHFIEDVTIELNGKPIASGLLSTAISRDPYLSLRLRGGLPGDRIKVSWRDNLGQSDSEEAFIE